MWTMRFHGKNSPGGMLFHNGLIRKESTRCGWAKRWAAPPPEGPPEPSRFTGFADFIRVAALRCGSGAQFGGTEVSRERRLWNETRQDVTSRWKCLRREDGAASKDRGGDCASPFLSASQLLSILLWLLVCPHPSFTVCPFIHPSPRWALPSIHLQSD